MKKSLIITSALLAVLFISFNIQAGVNTTTPSANEFNRADCGVLSVARLLEQDGRLEAAEGVRDILPASGKGHSVLDLERIANRYGLDLMGARLTLTKLKQLPLPVIIHLKGRPDGITGHYSVLEKIESNSLTIHDPQGQLRYTMPMVLFLETWSGVAVLKPQKNIQQESRMSLDEAGKIFGGDNEFPSFIKGKSCLGECCAYSACNSCDTQGGDDWAINPVSLNMVASSNPMSYTPAIGPSVDMKLTYNSQAPSGEGSTMFGNKWQFRYGGSAEEDGATGDVTVIMGDGRRDVYTSDGSGGYNKPYGVFNDLTKIAPNSFELKSPFDQVDVFQIPSGTSLTKPMLVEKRDARGNSLTVGYNPAGELTTVTDALGQATTLTYTAGKVTRVDGPFGRFAEYEYTGDNLTAVTNMGGIRKEYGYEGDSLMTGITDERGTTSFYNEFGDDPIQVSDWDEYPEPGGTMKAHHRITVTNPEGKKSEYYYNGLVGYGWYVSPRDYTVYVDRENNNLSHTVPKSVYFYEDTVKGLREEVGSVVKPNGSTLIMSRDYNTGKVMSRSDYDGNTIGYKYNGKGLVTSITPQVGTKTNFIYDTNEVDVLQIETPGLGSITMTYNAYHEVTSIEDQVGKRVDPITYNSYGQIETATLIKDTSPALTAGLTASMAPTTSILTEFVYYDPTHASKHRLKEVRRAGQVMGGLTYDTKGRVQTSTDAAGLTMTYEYNNLNQVTRVTYPDTRYEEYVYSPCCARLLESHTDRAGKTTAYTYDNLKRLIEIINPEDSRLLFDYDTNGNMTGFTDTNHNTTRFEYDLENRVTKKTYADGKSTRFEYNSTGLLARRIDARGIETNYIYNQNQALYKVLYSDNTPGITYEYDDFNRLQAVTDGIGRHEYTYYNDSSLHTVNGPWADDTITYVYDKLGRPESVTPQIGQAISYVYDDLDRLTGIISGNGTYTYGYTGADPMVQSLTRPNTSVTTYAYNDPHKRLTELSNKTNTDTIINKYVYSFTDTTHPDQRSSEEVTNGEAITSFTNNLVEYNTNRVNQVMSATNPNQNFVYDDSGNMTQGYTREGYAFTATYDAENRLKSIEYLDSGGMVHRQEYFYAFDSFLGQIKRYENSALVEDKRILRSGFLALQERDAVNVIQKEYTWGMNMGGGIGGLLSQKQGGIYHDYLYDGKGNVTALIDSVQAIASTYRYDAFGNLMTKNGSIEQQFMFSTKRYDSNTGLSYFGYRFYSASISKWITRDPLGERGGINLYAYVQNDPVNAIDPWGLYLLYKKSTNQMAWIPPVNDPFGKPAAIHNLNDRMVNYWLTQTGPHGDPIESGWYSVTGQETPAECEAHRMTDLCGTSAYKYRLHRIDGENREGLLIHPDGNVSGTAGCVGILGCAMARSFQEFMNSKLDPIEGRRGDPNRDPTIFLRVID